MSKKLVTLVFLTWFLFIPVAILNGIVRNNFYQPLIGELPAHQFSTLVGCILFIILAALILKKELVNLEIKQLFLIGLVWIGMTIVFEFVFGHYVVGHDWDKLLADYNLLQGRIWSLFLLNTGLTPFILKYLVK